MEPGHKPIPSEVFEVTDRHSVVGHKIWPKYSKEDVLQAVNGLDPKFCDDYDRVSQLTLLNILFFPCNNTYAQNYYPKKAQFYLSPFLLIRVMKLTQKWRRHEDLQHQVKRYGPPEESLFLDKGKDSITF